MVSYDHRKKQTNTQAANGGERKPNGRKAASVETSLTAFHFVLTDERGRTGKRLNLDNSITHDRKRDRNRRPRETTQKDSVGGQGRNVETLHRGTASAYVRRANRLTSNSTAHSVTTLRALCCL